MPTSCVFRQDANFCDALWRELQFWSQFVSLALVVAYGHLPAWCELLLSLAP